MTYEEDNKSLLDDLKNGDRKAGVFVYENYRKLLTVSAIIIVKDEEVAKDLVQQYYIDFFERKLYLKIKAPYNVKAYLVNSIRNRCLNWLRDSKRDNQRMATLLAKMPTFEPEHMIIEENPREKAIRQRLTAAFRETCQHSPSSAKALELRYYHGLSREEIAKRMGISVNTVRNNLIYGLKKLRQHFTNSDRL